MLPGGAPPDKVNEETLKGILADVNTVLGRIIGRTQRSETVLLRAAALIGNLRALQMGLLDTKMGPPPATLSREELCPPRKEAGGSSAASASKLGRGMREDLEDPLEEVVLLFDAAAELEGDADWHLVAELEAADAAVAGGTRGDWEFDGVAHRAKRKAAIEKAEADLRAKRQKQKERAERDERALARNRRSSEVDGSSRTGGSDSKLPRKSSTTTSSPPSAATGQPSAATSAGAAAAATAKSGGGKPPAATAPAAEVGATPAAEAPKAAAAPPAAAGQAEALQAFLKDHPEFMRVLKNPKKCLSDPRVKSMFMSELENYPLVKSFLAKKGLALG